jgi:hypothetical protein
MDIQTLPLAALHYYHYPANTKSPPFASTAADKSDKSSFRTEDERGFEAVVSKGGIERDESVNAAQSDALLRNYYQYYHQK